MGKNWDRALEEIGGFQSKWREGRSGNSLRKLESREASQADAEVRLAESRFRQHNFPASTPLEPYWVRRFDQAGIEFGSDAKVRRTTRPCFILRTAPVLLVAPLTTNGSTSGRHQVKFKLKGAESDGGSWRFGPGDNPKAVDFAVRVVESPRPQAFLSEVPPMGFVDEPLRGELLQFLGWHV